MHGMRGALERWLRGVVRWVFRTFGTLIERLVEVGFVQSGVVLAAQTFLALFPLLIAVVAIFPPSVGETVADTMRRRLGIAGSADATVQDLVASRDDLHAGITVLGAVVVLASATSFTRALQRVYEVSWGLPRLGLRSRVRGLLWLVGLVVYLVMLSTAIHLAGTSTPGTVFRTFLIVVAMLLLWWWTPYVLLLGRVRARALLPTGLVTGAAFSFLGGGPVWSYLERSAATSGSSEPSASSSPLSHGWSWWRAP